MTKEEIEKKLNDRVNHLIDNDPIAQRLLGSLDILRGQEEEPATEEE